MIERILIVGTGLVGASTGLALRAHGYGGAILGWDRDPAALAEAVRAGAVTEAAEDALAAAREADLVLLAGPVLAILGWMERLAPVLAPHQLATDVGSTKLAIAERAAELYNRPGRAAFLPGHPMAGREVSGAAHADASLFRGAVWLLTPPPAAGAADGGRDGHEVAARHTAMAGSGAETGAGARSQTGDEIGIDAGDDARAGAPPAAGADPRAARTEAEYRRLLEACGCRLLQMDARRHDELLAWVSHLPQLLSTALTALFEDEFGRDPDLRAIGGRAMREMTRLGASPYSMWRDIALTNTEPIERALAALEQRLGAVRRGLRTPALEDQFRRANRFRSGEGGAT